MGRRKVEVFPSLDSGKKNMFTNSDLFSWQVFEGLLGFKPWSSDYYYAIRNIMFNQCTSQREHCWGRIKNKYCGLFKGSVLERGRKKWFWAIRRIFLICNAESHWWVNMTSWFQQITTSTDDQQNRRIAAPKPSEAAPHRAAGQPGVDWVSVLLHVVEDLDQAGTRAGSGGHVNWMNERWWWALWNRLNPY